MIITLVLSHHKNHTKYLYLLLFVGWIDIFSSLKSKDSLILVVVSTTGTGYHFLSRKYFLTFLQHSPFWSCECCESECCECLECVRVGRNEERNYELFMMYTSRVEYSIYVHVWVSSSIPLTQPTFSIPQPFSDWITETTTNEHDLTLLCSDFIKNSLFLSSFPPTLKLFEH